jgi:general secretion pathway protein D
VRAPAPLLARTALAVLLAAPPALAQAPLRSQPKSPPAPRLAPPGKAPVPSGKAPEGAAETAKPAEKDPDEPPGAVASPPTSMDAIARATDTPYKPKPPGHLVKFNLQDADLAELVNHISGMTGKRFIYGPKVRQIKATVVSPAPITLEEAYQTFLSILEANGMTVIPHGRFLKIVDSGGVVTQPTPVYSRGAPVPDTDRFVTRLYRLKHVTAEEMLQLLTKFKSKEGDISIYGPGQLMILTDTGSNLRRMIRIIEEVDVGGSGVKMWLEPVHYGKAEDVAKQINEIFDLNRQGGGGGGLVKVIAEESSNSLIVVGTEDSYLKLLELLKRMDTAPAAEGRIHVLPLQHAVAEELANTLTQMLQGVAPGQRGQQAQGPGGPMFEGDLRVTADKATNSLIITSSGRDYAQLRLTIDQLDMARRQVFIEAVIMDVSVDHKTRLGMSYHGGTTADLGGGSDTLILAGFEAGNSLTFPANPELLQGVAVGARGPELAGTQDLLGTGLSIPAFGIVLNAIATSGDANVLATPHIIATDNVAAEINVGENIPLQDNLGSLNLGALGGLAGQAGQVNPAALLGGFGGLGFSAPRQDVGTKIKVTPHINDSNQVRLEIQEEISERGASSGALGAVSITKRNANTTVVVDDQQTVVIGGLMRDALVKTRRKIPVLGDLPVLGFLFRSSEMETRKTNLLLILTPHVIHDQRDLRRIFERKMQERQEFLDRYFVFSGEDWEPPRDYSRTNGLVEDIRQAYFRIDEQLRLEEESRPRDKREHTPTEPIELPSSVTPGPGTAPGPIPVPPTPGIQPGVQPQQPPSTRPPRRQRTPRTRPVTPGGAQPPGIQPPPVGQNEQPILINPVARSVNVERVE